MRVFRSLGGRRLGLSSCRSFLNTLDFPAGIHYRWFCESCKYTLVRPCLVALGVQLVDDSADLGGHVIHILVPFFELPLVVVDVM